MATGDHDLLRGGAVGARVVGIDKDGDGATQAPCVRGTLAARHATEIARGQRFEFGRNWARFLSTLDDRKIEAATHSLEKTLGVESLDGKRFLDIGSGSGLFSLAARRLGARVHSFDYDPQSVACTAELKRRYFPGDERWTIEGASVLDAAYLASLGRFDVVYCWGVLHHTGHMWQALENVLSPVAAGGQLCIAIYNDTGTQSARWKLIKKAYNRLPRVVRLPFVVIVVAPNAMKELLRTALSWRWREYLRSCSERGMTRWRDAVDWVGGYPYEVATPDAIFDFYKARGCALQKLKCGGVGLGCNEFVFVKGNRWSTAPVAGVALDASAVDRALREELLADARGVARDALVPADLTELQPLARAADALVESAGIGGPPPAAAGVTAAGVTAGDLPEEALPVPTEGYEGPGRGPAAVSGP